MPRKRKEFVRPSGIRDAKLIIIATEDTKASKKYFEDMVSPKYYQNPRVHVHVLDRTETASSPEHVIKMLHKFKREYSLRAKDELWLVIDVDNWESRSLSEVARSCEQKKYSLAVSNPCIEIWFLLHLRPLDENYDSETLAEFEENKKVNQNRTRLEQELITILGAYNKSNLNTDQLLPYVQEAIERARQMDTSPRERWPNRLGTRVYKLAESILG